MLKIAAAGPLRTAASLLVSNSTTLAGINHVALANAKHLLAANSARLAGDDAIENAEREHHAQVAHMAAR